MFSTDEAHEMVTLMSGQATDMGDLIEDLLVVARADIGKVTVAQEEVDLLTQLDHVSVGMSGELRDRISVELGSCVVLADEGRMRQIMRNLISNAIKYGGDKIAVSVRVDGDVAILVVADDGPGIPPHELHHIFTPYGGPTTCQGSRTRSASDSPCRARSHDSWVAILCMRTKARACLSVSCRSHRADPRALPGYIASTKLVTTFFRAIACPAPSDTFATRRWRCLRAA